VPHAQWMPTRATALKIALWYSVWSATWILFSGWLLHRLVQDRTLAAWLEDLKGWFFVGVTAFLLARLLTRYFREVRCSAQQLQDSEARMRLIGDNLPDGYVYQYMRDRDGRPRFTYISAGVERVHGLAAGDVLRDAGCLFAQFDPKQNTGLASAEAESARDLTDFETELRVRRADGCVRLIYIQSKPRRDGEGRVQWDGLALDITERKQAEDALREGEQQLRLFIEHSPAAIAMLDNHMRYLVASRRWLSDYRLKEGDLTGRSHYEIFPEIPERWKEIHRRCLAGAVEKRDADPFLRDDGSTDWVRWEIRPWYSNEGVIGGLIIFSEVITERVQAEQALRESEALLNVMGQAAQVGGWDLDPATGEAHWTSEVARIHDLDLAVRPNKAMGLEFYHGESRGRIQAALQAAIERGAPYDLELEIVSAKGVHKWIRSICRPVVENGKVVKLHGSLQDITHRKQVEAALRASLADQAALLKEVYHRVKNNLQIVSSLLNLQTRGVRNPAVLAALRDTQDRIRAMALLHETLYREGGVARVNCATYLDHLCTHLSQAFGPQSNRIRLERRIAAIDLGMDDALPCGLMVNELVSNAFKHAFPGERSGLITVEMQPQGDGRLRLLVADDGVGLLPADDSGGSGSMGLHLVRGLASQISATLEIQSPPGTVARIVFSPKNSPMEELP